MTWRRLAGRGMALVLALGVTACTSPDDAAGPPGGAGTANAAATSSAVSTASTAGGPALAWSPCDDGLECATLAVPRDPADLASGTLGLPVVRRPARAGPPAGTVVVNPGGPGASGAAYLRTGGPAGLDRFEVVSWDPRGIGVTSPGCDPVAMDRFRATDPAPTRPEGRLALDDAARDLAESCGRGDPAVLATASSATAADDLERLRVALGGSPLTYLGFSYGSVLGLRYADRYGDRVRAMVLDGVAPEDVSIEGLLAAQAAGLQPAADRALGDRRPAFEALRDQVAVRPLPGPTGALGPAELSRALLYSTYAPALGRSFREGLDQARAGDPTGLLELAASYGDATDLGGYLAVTCTDQAPPAPAGPDGFHALADRLAAVSPDLGRAVAMEVLPCAFWPAPVVAAQAGPGGDPPPLLLVGTTGDAATPLALAREVAAERPGSHLLAYTGEGHTAYGSSACVRRAVDGFLQDPAATPPSGC